MAKIQFIQGVDEEAIPDVKLSRSQDGANGIAKFYFDKPTVFDVYQGEITGLYLIDEEGELSTRTVYAKFINGKPQSIEASYIMNNREEWERFIRFMERYAKQNDLSFTKAKN
uniref:Photosystem II reaction center Psb28 protein n=1 Tax=Cyanophora paradoxa TaxID=2762 RepID=PSB28_CYAPA|nr:photosystem II protein W [Cyanophora paradoxa]P48264.1 RecName: Full=Photosystem II reaction center Psb28 protein; AltName: Full=Photosystem II 13 kDa protein; AltName: Full=Photosystem II reaction center W protein [Cyanophora paradoxa]AAA81264.1 subunit of the water oxidation complex on the lumenal surface of the photosystem II reaction center complex [Cyanophora paradoxa]